MRQTSGFEHVELTHKVNRSLRVKLTEFGGLTFGIYCWQNQKGVWLEPHPVTLLGDIMQELLMWKPEQSQIYLRYYLMAFLRGHILSVHLQQC